jgi:hypothetical protein
MCLEVNWKDTSAVDANGQEGDHKTEVKHMTFLATGDAKGILLSYPE